MIDVENLYFEWLLTYLDPDGVTEGVAYVGDLLHNCPFERRVGNDINRAIDGSNLRKAFMLQFSDADFDPHVTNNLMMRECSWFEMLIALAENLDYLYEGGVLGRFIELITNLELDPLVTSRPGRSNMIRNYDRRKVEIATADVDNNNFDRNGHGGLFPLSKDNHPDQRRVEIWDQHAAYFREKLEGVLF